MSNRKRIASVAFTGAAAAAALGMAAPAAFAGDGNPWHITPTGQILGVNSGPGTTATSLFVHGGAALKCVSGRAGAIGKVPSSQVTSTPAGTTVGIISETVFGTTTGAPCSGAGGVVKFKASTTNPLDLKAVSYNAAASSGQGSTTGSISGSIVAKLTGVSGTNCTATISGSHIKGVTYGNKTGNLAIEPSSSPLTITSVSGVTTPGHVGCSNLLSVGENAVFKGIYHLTPSAGGLVHISQ